MNSVTSTEQTVVVGLSEIAVSDDPGMTLTCLGLGSCVGLAAYDRIAHVGGLAHIVLPESKEGAASVRPGKFADTAIPELIRQMVAKGAIAPRLEFKAAGGAHMANLATNGALFAIGERNIAAVTKVLSSMNKKIRGSSLGEDFGRTMKLNVGTGEVVVSSAHLEPFRI